VRDEDARLAGEGAAEEAVVEDALADVGVDGGERVVEEDDVGAGVSGASQRDAGLQTFVVNPSTTP
jgi:hypothetical protein